MPLFPVFLSLDYISQPFYFPTGHSQKKTIARTFRPAPVPSASPLVISALLITHVRCEVHKKGDGDGWVPLAFFSLSCNVFHLGMM
jgi:hypothetical protein